MVDLELIAHRVNTIDGLHEIPQHLGTEIDIRAWGSELILNHEPQENGDRLVDYLDEYVHGTLILNVKETGIEDQVLKLVRERSEISSYFLLDVEFPYLFKATSRGEKAVSVRFSEAEPIESVEPFVESANWVWIDTITRMPVNDSNINTLRRFRTCVVCPSLWKRSKDIAQCRQLAIKYGLTAVMTEAKHISAWGG